MNCSKCGKRMPAGAVMCLACKKDLERVPDERIRLGYYARNPEALAMLLIQANSGDDIGIAVCQRDCSSDPDADIDCTDEKFAACIVRWLLEPIEAGQQPETVNPPREWEWMMNRFTRGEKRND